MLTKPIRKQRKEIVVKANNELYRIAKRDERNFVIEQLNKPKKADAKTPPTWVVNGFYGNLGDLVYGLVKLTIGIPKHSDLVEQVKLLREELKQVEKNILDQLTPLMEEVENA